MKPDQSTYWMTGTTSFVKDLPLGWAWRESGCHKLHWSRFPLKISTLGQISSVPSLEENHLLNKAGYTANKQSLAVGQGQHTEEQGQSICGQGLYFWWAGAVFLVGRGCYAQKSQIRSVSRHPKFRVTLRQTDSQTNQGTHPLIESLSQRLKKGVWIDAVCDIKLSCTKARPTKG